MENKTAVVFLDVDGVLNSRTTCVRTPSEENIGIDEARVDLLAKAIKETRMDGVVLTSTWKDMKKDQEDYLYLLNSLDKQGIIVLGQTKEKQLSKHEEGVLRYLEDHPEIEDFVILDDRHFGFRDYQKLWESFVDTNGRGIENAITAPKTSSIPAILFIDAIRKYA